MNDPYKYNIVNPKEKCALKHQVFFIWCKKECPLTFTERLIWSVLVKAERMAGKGTSQAKIAAWTGLNRMTVQKALLNGSLLLSSGLVVRENYRQWRAVEPPEQTQTWFSVRKNKGKHWSDRLAYWPVDLGDTHHEQVFDSVFWGLLALLKGQGDAVKHECHQSLATLLGCEYRRVKKALERLAENHLIEMINTAKNRYGKIVRFDVLFMDYDAAEKVDVPVVLAEPSDIPVKTESTFTLQSIKPSIGDQERVRISAYRATQDKMKQRLEAIGCQRWQVGQALWAMGYVPKQDKLRVFHAIINKHGHSIESVLSALEHHVEYRKRKQRTESQELIRLERMAECVMA